MGLRVEIVSRETVKPSSPTPESLKTFKLSFLDQLAPSGYVPIVFFYPAITTDNVSDKRWDCLKQSLTETLTQMYPLAGRIKDEFSIDCNDQGADYIQARVAEDISTLLNCPKIDLLQQLLPFNLLQMAMIPNTQKVILAVQVNEFSCGGTAIGVCINHVIADAPSVATFVKNWAAITTHSYSENNCFVTDCLSIFPPRCLNGFSLVPASHLEFMIRNTVTKRLVFDGSNISLLRKRIKQVEDNHVPTRVEAVLAFLWAAVISVAQASNGALKAHAMTCAVNLRKRLHPPLPPHVMGNIFQMTWAHWSDTETNTKNGEYKYAMLAKKVHNSIQFLNDDNAIRKMHEDGGQYFDRLKNLVGTFANGEVGFFGTSSWCRLPLYEADFGWGKPIWVGNCLTCINSAVLMDTEDGEGIEAWVGLSTEDMDKLERNSNFLSCVSSFQSV